MKKTACRQSKLFIQTLTLFFAFTAFATESSVEATQHELNGKKAEEKFEKMFAELGDGDFTCENSKLNLVILSNHQYHCGLVALSEDKISYSCLYYKKAGKIVNSELPIELKSLCDESEPNPPQHTISGFGHGIDKKDGGDIDIFIDEGDSLDFGNGGIDNLSPEQIEEMLKVLGEDNWLKLLKDQMNNVIPN